MKATWYLVIELVNHANPVEGMGKMLIANHWIPYGSLNIYPLEKLW